MAKSMVTKAVAYARFSSDHQREESIDAQLRAIHEYAQKNNIIIIGEYIDRAKSATTDNRPEFLRMIDDSKKHEFNAVVVHKLDRFSRNRYDAEFYKRTLLRNGVSLKSVTENFDGSPESVILESVIQGMSEYYSKNLAREVMKGLKENAFSCRHTGGLPPLGYNLDKETQKLVINEDEAKIVQFIYKQAIDGVGYASIADELNRKGCKTKIGRNFTANSISTLLRNPKYVGNYIYNRSSSKDIDGKRNGHAYKDKSEWIIIEGGCPAIISKEDFEIISEKRERDKTIFLGHKHIEEYLLTGKIVCGCCGGSFVGERRWDKRRVRSYVKYCCNIKKRQGASVCESRYIDRDALESLILRTLAQEIFCEGMVERIAGYYNQYCESMDKDKKEHVEGLVRKQKELARNIETLVDMITKTQSEALLGRLSRLEDEKKGSGSRACGHEAGIRSPHRN